VVTLREQGWAEKKIFAEHLIAKIRKTSPLKPSCRFHATFPKNTLDAILQLRENEKRLAKGKKEKK
jgi:hypothetical protein